MNTILVNRFESASVELIVHWPKSFEPVFGSRKFESIWFSPFGEVPWAIPPLVEPVLAVMERQEGLLEQSGARLCLFQNCRVVAQVDLCTDSSISLKYNSGFESSKADARLKLSSPIDWWIAIADSFLSQAACSSSKTAWILWPELPAKHRDAASLSTSSTV